MSELRLRMEKLRRDHAVDGFDCGKETLNRFLARHVLQSQQSGATTTYVAMHGDEVVGFHSLSVGQMEYADARERLARHPGTVMPLARTAVASRFQGRKLGATPLRDAMPRTLQAAEIAGIRAFVVHAKDDETRAVYERFDFLASPTGPYHPMLLLTDVRAWLGSR